MIYAAVKYITHNKYVTDYKSVKISTGAIRQYMKRTDVYIHIRFPSEL